MFKINVELTAEEWRLLWALFAVKKAELKEQWNSTEHLDNLSSKLFSTPQEHLSDRF